MNKRLKYIFSIYMIMLWTGLSAQEMISLDNAIEKAQANNIKLQSQGLMVQYNDALINTAYNLAPTQINAELGQFNSSFFDSGLGISQSFNLPKVYRSRENALKQQAKGSAYQMKLSIAEIKQQIEQLFNEHNYLFAKALSLQYQDSLYSIFLDKTKLRWQSGETDVLEKATAEQQLLNISHQLTMVEKMKETIVLQINNLINDGKKYQPQNSRFDVLKYNIFYDTLSIRLHPVLQIADQEIETARANTKVEQAALLPEITAAYRNMSIRGTGADNITYKGTDRFNSFQVGVGIPIFRKSANAYIKSAKVFEQVKSKEYIAKKNELVTNINQLLLLYNETNAQLLHYEQQALPNAKLIRSVSEKQFSNGQINYLEYVMLTNQAIAIEGEYLELKRNLNSYIIELHYLTTYN